MSSDHVDDVRVLARTPRAPRWWLFFLPVQGATTAYWLWRFVVEEAGVARGVVVTISAALLVALVAALVQAWRRRGGAALVLGDRELRVERRVKPVVIARSEVLAVRGNIRDRPSWSDHVVIETPHEVIALPALDTSPGVLVPTLQGWAGVSESAAEQ